MKHILIFSSLFLLSSCVKPVALDRAVLDDTKRPTEERAQDDSRKAIDVYTFMGVKPGMTVADLWPGGGYNTHLLSRLMGSNGRVYCMMGFYGSGRYDMLDKIKTRITDTELDNVEVFDKPSDLPPGSIDVMVSILKPNSRCCS